MCPSLRVIMVHDWVHTIVSSRDAKPSTAGSPKKEPFPKPMTSSTMVCNSSVLGLCGISFSSTATEPLVMKYMSYPSSPWPYTE